MIYRKMSSKWLLPLGINKTFGENNFYVSPLGLDFRPVHLKVACIDFEGLQVGMNCRLLLKAKRRVNKESK